MPFDVDEQKHRLFGSVTMPNGMPGANIIAYKTHNPNC